MTHFEFRWPDTYNSCSNRVRDGLHPCLNLYYPTRNRVLHMHNSYLLCHTTSNHFQFETLAWIILLYCSTTSSRGLIILVCNLNYVKNKSDISYLNNQLGLQTFQSIQVLSWWPFSVDQLLCRYRKQAARFWWYCSWSALHLHCFCSSAS